MDNNDVLPYRTGAPELLRWVEARARGRSAAQLRGAGGSAKTQEGTAVAAEALGFWERERDRLTRAGERLALAGEAERERLLRAAVLAYEPYARLLEAVAERPERTVTEVQWIETWWATHGYGNSQSNRAEGTAALGRFAEQLGLGRYIPGRRGHPTRIEWREEVLAGAERPGEEKERSEPAPPPERVPEAPRARPRPAPADPALRAAPAERTGGGPSRPGPAVGPGYNEVSVPLAGGMVARLVVPQRLAAMEKRRLLDLLDLLISEE